jgi:hypothetical protein
MMGVGGGSVELSVSAASVLLQGTVAVESEVAAQSLQQSLDAMEYQQLGLALGVTVEEIDTGYTLGLGNGPGASSDNVGMYAAIGGVGGLFLLGALYYYACARTTATPARRMLEVEQVHDQKGKNDGKDGSGNELARRNSLMTSAI